MRVGHRIALYSVRDAYALDARPRTLLRHVLRSRLGVLPVVDFLASDRCGHAPSLPRSCSRLARGWLSPQPCVWPCSAYQFGGLPRPPQSCPEALLVFCCGHHYGRHSWRDHSTARRTTPGGRWSRHRAFVPFSYRHAAASVRLKTVAFSGPRYFDRIPEDTPHPIQDASA